MFLTNVLVSEVSPYQIWGRKEKESFLLSAQPVLKVEPQIL